MWGLHGIRENPRCDRLHRDRGIFPIPSRGLEPILHSAEGRSGTCLLVAADLGRGIVLGLLEAFAASYLSLLTGGAFGAEYKDIFAFSVLILILIFRPKGLLGEVVRERA